MMERQISRLFFAFITAVALNACNTTPKTYDLSLPSELNTDAARSFSQDEIRYDIEQLKFALNRGYAGRKFLPEGEFRTLINDLDELAMPTSPPQLCYELAQAFAKVSDAHLSANWDQKRCGTLPRRPGFGVGKNFFGGPEPWKVALSAPRKNRRALLISIRSFPSATDPVWGGFLESVKKNLAKAAFVVLDLRGNEGGDDAFGIRLAALLAGQELKSPYRGEARVQTPEAHQLWVNYIDYRIRVIQGRKVAVPSHWRDLYKVYQDRLETARQKPESYEIEVIDAKPGAEFDLAKSIRKPIYILMDRDTVSSGESTIDYFETNPLVKRIGENTGGLIHFGNSMLLMLKNSGVIARIATQYNSYADGRFIEKTGIKPDVSVPNGEDALEYAWREFFKSGKAKR